MNAEVRITVLRRTIHEDLLRQYAESVWAPCERLGGGPGIYLLRGQHARGIL